MGTVFKEVEGLEKPQHRRLKLEYKRRIVREADRCREPGEVEAPLKEETMSRSRRTQGGPASSSPLGLQMKTEISVGDTTSGDT